MENSYRLIAVLILYSTLLHAGDRVSPRGTESAAASSSHSTPCIPASCGFEHMKKTGFMRKSASLFAIGATPEDEVHVHIGERAPLQYDIHKHDRAEDECDYCRNLPPVKLIHSSKWLVPTKQG